MYGLRRIAIVLLAAITIVVAIGAAVWGASLSGIAHAEIVSTDDSAPGLEAGDLVVVVPAAAAGSDDGAAAPHDDAVTMRVPVVGGIAAAVVEPRYAIPTMALVLLLGVIVLVSAAPAAAPRGRP